MEMKFKIKENGFDEVRKKMILRTIPIALIAACGGLAISHFNTNGQSSDVNVLPFVIPIIIGAMAFGLRKGIKRQKSIFDSYELTIDNERIIRRQNLTPDIEIQFSQIKEISKNKNGSLTIKGENLNNSIGVPSQIENMIELESILSKLFKITTSDKQSFQQKYPWVLSILTIVLMMVVYIAKNRILVGFAGSSLTIGLIYSLVITQKSKHLDKKTKRGMWFTLIVLFSVIAITYLKVFGN
tara:strand:+ start:1571 stop:2293 length:723 start_codon:yes stop_codon:yes gene_type:complete